MEKELKGMIFGIVAGMVTGILMFGVTYGMTWLATDYSFDESSAKEIAGYFQEAKVIDLTGDDKFEVIINNGKSSYLIGRNLITKDILVRKFHVENRIEETKEVVFE